LKSASLQYANALADVALAQGAAVPVMQQLGDFAAAYESSAELRNFLASPAVSKTEKRQWPKGSRRAWAPARIVRNFLFVVIDHRAHTSFPESFSPFRQVIRERQGIAEAEIFSPTTLNDAQKKEITQALEKLTGKKVEAKFSLDARLLGGALGSRRGTRFTTGRYAIAGRLRERLAAE
jgi:F-type H+-transporting ATPase subunit delta